MTSSSIVFVIVNCLSIDNWEDRRVTIQRMSHHNAHRRLKRHSLLYRFELSVCWFLRLKFNDEFFFKDHELLVSASPLVALLAGNWFHLITSTVHIFFQQQQKLNSNSTSSLSFVGIRCGKNAIFETKQTMFIDIEMHSCNERRKWQHLTMHAIDLHRLWSKRLMISLVLRILLISLD